MVSDELRDELLRFRSDREWEQFHNLRTLSTSVLIEAAELAELTQWARDEQDIASVLEAKGERIGEEVADIAILMTYLIHDCGIDLEAAVRRKIELNGRKYPVERARGSARKYDEFE